jgi:hypothetical protein
MRNENERRSYLKLYIFFYLCSLVRLCQEVCFHFPPFFYLFPGCHLSSSAFYNFVLEGLGRIL